MVVIVEPKKAINGLFSVPGDKSVSHRAFILAAISEGKTEIEGFLAGEDCISTINCLRELGVKIELEGNRAVVWGVGLRGFKKPSKTLYAGNSGTTIRLLSGILAAQPFETVITGDVSVCSRPMRRIIEPLELMGAKIQSENGGAPLVIKGEANLKGISYTSKISSAQVKSCILLAGLYARGETAFTEPAKSRDHTEIMLKYLGADVKTAGNTTVITGRSPLRSRPIYVCGDMSSAAFIIVGAAILEGSEVIITNVGVNFTRTGIISVLREMGADIEVLNRRSLCGEFVADIRVRSSELRGIDIGGDVIPKLIDEIPILAVAALFAKGETVIKDAAELKVKETNRIDALAAELGKMGGEIEGTSDGLIIEGGKPLRGAVVNSRGDHRIAMALAVAALRGQGETSIENGECVDISFPGFYELLKHFK